MQDPTHSSFASSAFRRPPSVNSECHNNRLEFSLIGEVQALDQSKERWAGSKLPVNTVWNKAQAGYIGVWLHYF